MLKKLMVGGALAVSVGALADEVPPPLPVEPVGIIESLPARYPADWFLIQDGAFFHMSDGKVIVIDPTQEGVGDQVKGMFNVSLMGNIMQAPGRGEIYATETFHSRGTRGPRIDVLSIWDMENLSAVGEVILPQGKRFMGMPAREVMHLLNNDKWLAIFNLSPATSVTLVDLDTREIVSEVPTPGCSHIYPAGDMAFTSVCADGRFTTTHLTADGEVKERTRSDVFFDSDETPIFERPAIIDGMAYFPSFKGMLYPVDLSGDVAVPQEPWSIAGDIEGEWAASGIRISDEDSSGAMYLLMNPEAANTDGKHNEGGPEVWVFDPGTQTLLRRIALQEWGLSIAVSRGPDPKMLVTNPVDMSVELYDATTGDFIRKLSDIGQETPLYLYPAL
ncbi:amine dehydrogenase large subunit [Luminiphilus syltensis]|nr:amine dehydrogenase large subunit [Luminiphilus syltensis]